MSTGLAHFCSNQVSKSPNSSNQYSRPFNTQAVRNAPRVLYYSRNHAPCRSQTDKAKILRFQTWQDILSPYNNLILSQHIAYKARAVLSMDIAGLERYNPTRATWLTNPGKCEKRKHVKWKNFNINEGRTSYASNAHFGEVLCSDVAYFVRKWWWCANSPPLWSRKKYRKISLFVCFEPAGLKSQPQTLQDSLGSLAHGAPEEEIQMWIQHVGWTVQQLDARRATIISLWWTNKGYCPEGKCTQH